MTLFRNPDIHKQSIHWHRLLLVLLVVAALFGVALYRTKIDTDILSVMPTDDPVIADSAAIFRHHPMQNRIMIDISAKENNPDRLIAVATRVSTRLSESGLFATVGNEAFQKLMPTLFKHVLAHLPVLFTEKELNTYIKPRLQPDEIKRQIQTNYNRLLSLESIGQAATMVKDPLNFRDLILSKLSSLAPSSQARMHRGHILSIDGHHLLLTAQPLGSSTDTSVARKIASLTQRIKHEITTDETYLKDNISITPMGAYRAALDNEEIIRKDVTFAILLATIGIAVLLVFAFPRPWIGLLALLPAAAGTMLALFVYSLFNSEISIMVLGFGGAIISITVDHGIAYLLFLDRSKEVDGQAASEEVRAVGLLTVLTSIGAFTVLCFSGFPIFVQLGQFSALGIGFSFLFVHTVFPKVFPKMPPGKKQPFKFQKWVDTLAGAGPKGAWAALAFVGIMCFFAAPRFDVGMQSMNTVSVETQSAEKRITEVWGNLSNKVYLMTEGRRVQDLLGQGDDILKRLDQDMSIGVLSSGFVPSQLFPGKERRQENFAAWKKFWDGKRVQTVSDRLKNAGRSLGFAEDAFASFFELLTAASPPPMGKDLPASFIDFMGISQDLDQSKWYQVLTLTTGPEYDATRFRNDYTDVGRIFDPAYFSTALGNLLFNTFTKLLVLVAISVIILLILFFLDFKLTIAALLPVAFALIATVGTLNLLGRPIDIPGLMLSVVVLGMGIDYSLFFVRSHQRYETVGHPSFGLIRMAVFMAAVSTLIGFGVLIFARHTLLKSAGLTSFLGIGYALLGAFLILPPVLTYIRRDRSATLPEAGHIAGDIPDDSRDDIEARVLNRYRRMEAYPRLFARFKMKLDPMFSEIVDTLHPETDIRSIIDVGSGYGVPGSWLLERFPNAFLYGIEPIRNRVRIATRAVGKRGVITVGGAPDLPEIPHPVDLAVMLDMAHFLDDEALNLALHRLHTRVKREGRLIARVSIKPQRKYPWVWWLENTKLLFGQRRAYYRTQAQLETMIRQAGFQIEHVRFSGPHQELIWIVAGA